MNYKTLKRLKIITTYKKYLDSKNYKTKKTLETKQFMNNLLKTIGLFFDKNCDIEIVSKQLNRQKVYEHMFLIKNNFINFRKFKNADFFKDGLNLLFITINQKGSAQIIVNYISYQIKRIKRQKYFISFLKKILTTLIKNSPLKGIKIKITGRFNGAPRSKSTTILINNMPLHTINLNIEHAQATAYTKDGTFGIKAWVYE